MSSPLYSKLLSLSETHAKPNDLDQIMSIRAPDAIHAWGHNYLLSRSPGLRDRMDNDAFKAHLESTGPYLAAQDPEVQPEVHDIIIDIVARKSAIHMSYFLTPEGSTETVENDLIWLLKFTDDDEVDGILIKESVEFIDPTASARLGTVIRALHGGKLNPEVRGGITLKQGTEPGGLCH